jgi:hypothetical protein
MFPAANCFPTDAAFVSLRPIHQSNAFGEKSPWVGGEKEFDAIARGLGGEEE